MKGLIDATGLDSLRPFAAVLPHMFYGLKVPPLLYRVSHTIETAFVSFPRAVMGVLGGIGHEMGAHEHHLEAEIKKGRQKRAGPQNKGPGVGDGKPIVLCVFHVQWSFVSTCYALLALRSHSEFPLALRIGITVPMPHYYRY